MKIKALIAVALFTVHSIAAAEPAAEGPFLLSAGEMDGVTAAGFSTYVSAAAEFAGRYTMTTTGTGTLVRVGRIDTPLLMHNLIDTLLLVRGGPIDTLRLVRVYSPNPPSVPVPYDGPGL